MHYSLSAHKREVEPLRSQAQEFISWISESDQFDRGTAGSVADSTVKNIMETVYLFLGYLEHHKGITTPISMLNFLNPEEYIEFISFSVAKGRTITSITNLIGHTKKVFTWLSNSNPQLVPQIKKHNLWLDNVRGQLKKSIPRKKRDIGELEDAGKWIEPGDLVVLIDKLVKRVLGYLEVGGEGPLGPALALSLHNCTMASCLFSWIPPVRLVCWRTLQAPGTKGCLKADCRNPACQGNRLYYNKAGALSLLLSHYKVNKR